MLIMEDNSRLYNLETSKCHDNNWQHFYLLRVLASFILLSLIPYTPALQKDNLKEIHLPLPLLVVVSIEIIQIFILGLLTGTSPWLAMKIGLGAPMILVWSAGRRLQQEYRNIWLTIVLIGLAIDAIVVFLDDLVVSPQNPKSLQSSGLHFSRTQIHLCGKVFWQLSIAQIQRKFCFVFYPFRHTIATAFLESHKKHVGVKL